MRAPPLRRNHAALLFRGGNRGAERDRLDAGRRGLLSRSGRELARVPRDARRAGPRRDWNRVVVVMALNIREARVGDIPSLIEIERAAGDMFRSLSMDFVADDDPGSPAELAPYTHGQRAFVSTDEADTP